MVLKLNHMTKRCEFQMAVDAPGCSKRSLCLLIAHILEAPEPMRALHYASGL